jgi:probable phosphoglycerate mutase
MPRTQIYLARHGEKGADGGLSDLGREQADALGRRLGGVSFAAVHHSVLPRAAETADVVGGYLPGVPVHACDHALDRTPIPAHPHEYPQRWRRWLDTVPEAERDVDAARLRDAVEHLGVVGDRDRRELVITHNFVIGWFVRHALDAPTWRWIGLDQANCALTIVQWETGRPPTLVCFNDVGHLTAQA